MPSARNKFSSAMELPANFVESNFSHGELHGIVENDSMYWERNIDVNIIETIKNLVDALEYTNGE